MAEFGIISTKGRNGTAELLKIIADEHDHCIPAAARFAASSRTRSRSFLMYVDGPGAQLGS